MSSISSVNIGNIGHIDNVSLDINQYHRAKIISGTLDHDTVLPMYENQPIFEITLETIIKCIFKFIARRYGVKTFYQMLLDS